jgi:hypothetical protein
MGSGRSLRISVFHVEATRGARRGEELLDGDLERARRAVEDRERGVGRAGLEVGPGGAGHAGELRELLLRHPARLPELLEVAAEPAGQILVCFHARRLDALQRIGTESNRWEGPGYGRLS